MSHVSTPADAETANGDGETREAASFEALTAGAPHAGPLVKLRVKMAVKDALKSAKRPKAKTALTKMEQEDAFAHVTDDVIDAAYQAAVTENQHKVGGPLIDWFKNNPELIAKIVQIILAALLGA